MTSSTEDWNIWDRLRYYWRNCRRWYRRSGSNRIATWVFVLGLLLLAAALVFADERRSAGRRILPPDFPELPEGVESFEAPVPKSLADPFPECRTGWGMTWKTDPDDRESRNRQTWSAWPCGSFWAFRYQEWEGSPDGLIWYYIKLREFWYDVPVQFVDRFPATFDWLLERYPPGSPPAEVGK